MNLDSSSSSSSCQSQWTPSSTYSNNISNLLDSADAPLEASQQKVKVRRSTRRRTLAPIYNSQINISANDKDDADDEADRCSTTDIPSSPGHKSIASSVKRARNNSELMDHDNDNGYDNHASQEDHNQISSQSMSMDLNISAGTNAITNACSSNANSSNANISNANSNSNSTPPKQKRARRNQRRRSLAVQDGHLLLGPASSGSSSAHTMSSLSHVSSSGFSSFSAMEVQSSTHEHDDGISILSSSDKQSQKNNKGNNNDDDEEGNPRPHLETIDNCDASITTNMTGNGSEGTSSTLSKICNGVAAMIVAHDKPSAEVGIGIGIKKQEARKRRLAKGKKTVSTPAPTRRSARIRKSIVASKVTSASTLAKTSPDATLADVANHESCNDRTSIVASKVSSSSKLAQTSPDATFVDVANHESCNDEQEIIVKFRLSTLSPKQDKCVSENHAATTEVGQKTNVVIDFFGGNHVASRELSTKPPEQDNTDAKNHAAASAAATTELVIDIFGGNHDASKEQSTKLPKQDETDAKNHAATTAAVIKEGHNTNIDIGSSGGNHVASKEQPPLKNRIKQKRRRRSSLGVHVGGLVSLKDIEALQKDAAARRKLKTTRGLQSSQVVEAESNARICDDTETDNCNPDVDANVKKPTVEEKNVDFSVVHSVDLNVKKPAVDEKIVDFSVVHSVDGNVKKPAAEEKNVDFSVVHSVDLNVKQITEEDTNENFSVVHCLQNGKQKVLDEAVPSPCSIVCSEGETVPQSEEHFQVSSEAIQATMKDVFNALEFGSKPCVTPRLFTCAILLLQHKGYSMEQISPIIPLLRSFVSAEAASLKDLDSTKEVRRKKLHFCSFDFSSTITPFDTAVESIDIIETCISKLHGIIQEAEKLSAKGDCDNNVRTIEAFVNALTRIENEDKVPSYTQCSKAMPFAWPKGRFRKASIQYRQELSVIIVQIRSIENPRISFVRTSLGDFIGRAIRFYLRRYFNPVPLPLYSDSENLPDYSSSRSRVHEIIEMRDTDDGGRDTATADGSISAVIGIALQRMIQFFELNCELVSRDGCQIKESYCNTFCNRPASIGGLLERGCVVELSQEAIDEVLLDIEESHTILAGIRACRFVKSLLTWPGVSDAVSEAGGWNKIEALANIFQRCNLSHEMPAEDHFILLSNVDALVHKIKEDSDVLIIIEKHCEDSLRKLWKKFRCGKRNKDLLELNPCIQIFQRELKEGVKKTILPSIADATSWE